jgi:hypothetical protein
VADITVTAANVVRGSGASVADGIAGATITAGQTVYIDTGDSNKLKLADCDSGTVAVRTLAGIALHGSLSGQPLRYLTAGPITIGGTVAPGRYYVLSDTAGGIMPEEDLEAGDYFVGIGYGLSATDIQVDIKYTTVAVDA